MVGGSSRRRPIRKDEATVRALYAEHGGAVLAYATKLTKDRAAAEDVLQETLVRAWRKVDLLVNGRGSVRAWMFTVAHNIVVDRARARATRPVEVGQHPSAEPLADDHADRVVDSITVLDAIDTLSAILAGRGEVPQMVAQDDSILVIGANEAQIEELEALVLQIDIESEDVEQRMFELQYADPGQIREAILTMLSPQPGRVVRRTPSKGEKQRPRPTPSC